MSFRHAHQTYWEPNPEKPLEGHNLADEADLRAADLEVLVRQLFLSLRDHKPVSCHACMGTLLQAEQTLKRLGIHV